MKSGERGVIYLSLGVGLSIAVCLGLAALAVYRSYQNSEHFQASIQTNLSNITYHEKLNGAHHMIYYACYSQLSCTEKFCCRAPGCSHYSYDDGGVKNELEKVTEQTYWLTISNTESGNGVYLQNETYPVNSTEGNCWILKWTGYSKSMHLCIWLAICLPIIILVITGALVNNTGLFDDIAAKLKTYRYSKVNDQNTRGSELDSLGTPGS